MLIAMISLSPPDLEFFFFILIGCQTECPVCLDLMQEAESLAAQEFMNLVF